LKKGFEVEILTKKLWIHLISQHVLMYLVEIFQKKIVVIKTDVTKTGIHVIFKNSVMIQEKDHGTKIH